ncbi:hypothetical protein [Alkanindiges illinoisensis]|uniref:hypothetical protein n=1 Tax=Alkanindiges illinoisensis TaxID=197183 RepID=UPI00047B11E2|nr:hypothetical protein [Alkanindiges illinoisensis]
MKTLRVLAVSAAVLAVTSPAFADEKVVTDEGIATFSFFKPASVRIEGGTTGYGGAIAYGVNQYTDVVLGYNGGDAADLVGGEVKYNGVEYDLEQDNNTAYLNAEIRPFGNWFHVALGTAYNDNEYKVSTRNNRGDITINGTKFDNATANVRGRINYKNDIVPYIGFGVSPSITSRIGLFAQVGAFYNGNPEVHLDTDTPLATGNNGQTLRAALDEEERDIRNDDKYKWMPVGKVGLSFRF